VSIRGVIFDMDGVLIDAKDWHFRALNRGLELFGEKITYEEHLSRFDGLPTKVKLKMLSDEGRLDPVSFRFIEAVKQEWTLREAATLCFPNIEHLVLLGNLSASGLKLGVATNSIRKTTVTMLTYAGVFDFFDVILTNEDVKNSKPHPEIYEKACQELGLSAEECLVVEDTELGSSAAFAAGCQVMRVSNPSDLIASRFSELIKSD
jgi:beta-phosphoglucomutase